MARKKYKFLRKLAAVLGIFLLLLGAYRIPTVVAQMEDQLLERESKSYEIDAISITSTGSSFREELKEFSGLTTTDLKIEVQVMEEEKYNLTVDEAKNCVEEFLEVFNALEKVEIKKFSAQMTVMYSEKTGNVYEVWVCDAYDSNMMEYILWLDDATGRVLAFDCQWNWDWTLSEFINNLAEYYGYTEGALEDENQFYAELDNHIFFWKEEESLSLPFSLNGEWLCFNVYMDSGASSVSSY